MKETFVLLVNGKPATGKTTIAKKIAGKLSVPCLCRDELKELLFDDLGTGDREWSRKLGKASFDLMYFIVESLLRGKQSFVVETAFSVKLANEKWRFLLAKYPFNLLQVFCETREDIRQKRFISRNKSGERHLGHVDHLNYKISFSDVSPIDCSDKLIRVNTDDFDKVKINKIIDNLFA